MGKIVWRNSIFYCCTFHHMCGLFQCYFPSSQLIWHSSNSAPQYLKQFVYAERLQITSDRESKQSAAAVQLIRRTNVRWCDQLLPICGPVIMSVYKLQHECFGYQFKRSHSAHVKSQCPYNLSALLARPTLLTHLCLFSPCSTPFNCVSVARYQGGQ